jgi:PAS domain S-box-containing protein
MGDFNRFNIINKTASNEEDIYMQIFESSGEAVFITDGSFKIIEANAAGCGLCGCEREEVAGVKLSEFIHPNDLSLYPFLRDPAVSFKENFEYGAHFIKKDKTVTAAQLCINNLSGDLFMISASDFKKLNPDGFDLTGDKTEEMLYAAADALPLWIACVDTEGRYFYANKYYSSTFKIPIENIIGHKFSEFFPPALYEKHKSLFDECIGDGVTVTFEDESDFENGSKFYTYGIYTPLFDADNKVFAMSAAVFDITAKKELEFKARKAAEDLKESFEKYKALVENSIYGIGISSGDKIIYANDTLMKIFGYDDFTEFSSKKMIDYHTPASRRFIETIREKKARGENAPDKFEADIIHKDGRPRTLMIALSEILIDGQNCYECTFVDITEKKKAEDLIKKLADRYEYIVSASGQIVYDYNVITGRIEWGNTIEKILGYNLKEVNEGFNQWTGMLHPDDKGETLRKLQEAEDLCSLLDAEYRLKHKAGHYIWLRDKGFFLPGPSGRAVRQLGMIEDITEKKKDEETVIRSLKQAEADSAAKSIFLANISHEIRTPVTDILDFTNLLSAIGLNERQKEFNDIIKNSSTHLLALINDILDFSKLEAGIFNLDIKPFDIKDSLNDLISLISEQAEVKKLEFESFIDERISYKVNGDKHRFEQILINLLTNAVKFTLNGKIGINISQIKTEDNAKYNVKDNNDKKKVIILIEVYDTGIGIAAEKKDEIFEMFHQLDESSTKRHGGSGIGLSIVKGLVELMNGTISLESEAGKGSRFKVSLPFDII